MKEIIKSNALPYLLLGLTLLFIIKLFWPGEMTSDSWGQHSAAVAGSYTNHHPAVMSFVWKHLLWIHPISGGIFILHMALIVSAILIFMHIFKNSRWLYFYGIVLLLPPILQFSFFIWKDVGMTYAYLFSAGILALATMEERKLKVIEFVVLLLALFYGTAVKYQGQFILPIFCFWMSLTPLKGKIIRWELIKAPLVYAVIMGSVYLTNAYLVPPSKDSHSWQKVKIYDLAGMSLELDHPLFPEYILKNQYFDMKRVKELFNRYRVDELLFREDTPVPEGKTEFERTALMDKWIETVKTHPLAYLKTRFLMWIHNFTERPFKSSASIEKSERLNQYVPFIANNKACIAFLEFILESLRFIWWLPIVFLYIGLGIFNWKRSQASKVLVFMNILGLSLPLILFMFSMAATARYIYLTIVMLHFSHPFAWLAFKSRKFS